MDTSYFWGKLETQFRIRRLSSTENNFLVIIYWFLIWIIFKCVELKIFYLNLLVIRADTGIGVIDEF